MFEISKQSILALIIVWICSSPNYHANAESCHGAIVRNGTNQTIVDANNDTWTIKSDNTIYINDETAGTSWEVILLVYWNQVVYQQNRNGGWWRWVNKGSPWANANDPRPSSPANTASGCTLNSHPDDLSTEMTTTNTSTDPSNPITTAITTDETMIVTTGKPSSPFFVPIPCNDRNYMGDFCNTSMQPCAILKPCRNLGNCVNDPHRRHGYSCICKSGYTGTECELDNRLCRSNTCLYNGICKELNNTNFYCNCTQGRTGIHCEHLIDYCDNVTCLNKGICRSLLLDYKCECLFGTSGWHCGNVATPLLIRQYVSKGFAYIAIIVLISAAGFIIVLDILKYGFGIDPVREERERLRHERVRAKEKNHEKLKSLKTYRQ